MKNLIFTILALTLFCVNVTAQECGTPTDGQNQVFPYQGDELYDEAPFCINVFYHIVRQSNGTGGLNPIFLDDVTELLNTAFNDHNVFIVEEGRDFIDSDQFFNLSRSEFENQIAPNDNPNVINIYFVNQSYSGAAGAAEGILSNSFNVANEFALTSTTPHELGHCLNLWHTHHGIEPGGCLELIDGSNCNNCGDFVCDTPADPRLSGKVDIACIYTGTDTQNGTPYNPDTRNYMSYSRRACRDSFSLQQGQRMRNTILGSDVLSQTLNEDCLNLNGPDNFCSSATYTLSDVPAGAIITWNVSPTGIANLSANGTTATLTRITNGSVELSANIQINTGTLFISKDVEVGTQKPTEFLEAWYDPYLRRITLRVENLGAGYTYNWVVEGTTYNNRTHAEKFRYNVCPSSLDDIRFRVQAVNSCGTSQWLFGSIDRECDTGGGPFPFRVSPNPAKDQLNIQLENQPHNIEKRSYNKEFKVFVINQLGNVDLQFENVDLTAKQTLNISNLKNGIYTIVIENNGMKESQQFIIRK